MNRAPCAGSIATPGVGVAVLSRLILVCRKHISVRNFVLCVNTTRMHRERQKTKACTGVSEMSSVGWIDFSSTDRKRVHEVLAMLKDPGTLDELGRTLTRSQT